MKSVRVEDLQTTAALFAHMPKFDASIEDAFSLDPRYQLSNSRHVSLHGLQWIWFEWLRNVSTETFRERIHRFVERGIVLQNDETMEDDRRAIHDIYLIHCAIFIKDRSLFDKVAVKMPSAYERLADRTAPFGDSCHTDAATRAWCGMLKSWLQGDVATAREQAVKIYTATRPLNKRLPSKPLVDAFLASDWKKFNRSLNTVFTRLWNDARKYKHIVREENEHAVYKIGRLSITTGWPWPEIGLALLAHTQGVEVVTDPLWFPPIALQN